MKLLIKRFFNHSVNTIFLVDKTIYSGIHIGFWIGLFSGFFWVIASSEINIKYIELGASIFSPFILKFFINDNIQITSDYREAIFIISSSSVAGFFSIIGTIILKWIINTPIDFSAINLLSGSGIGLLIGSANALMIIRRGI